MADDPMAHDRVSFSLEKDVGNTVEQQQGAIARNGVVDEAKGGKDAITRTCTSPEDEQAAVAASQPLDAPRGRGGRGDPHR